MSLPQVVSHIHMQTQSMRSWKSSKERWCKLVINPRLSWPSMMWRSKKGSWWWKLNGQRRHSERLAIVWNHRHWTMNQNPDHKESSGMFRLSRCNQTHLKAHRESDCCKRCQPLSSLQSRCMILCSCGDYWSDLSWPQHKWCCTHPITLHHS